MCIGLGLRNLDNVLFIVDVMFVHVRYDKATHFLVIVGSTSPTLYDSMFTITLTTYDCACMSV